MIIMMFIVVTAWGQDYCMIPENISNVFYVKNIETNKLEVKFKNVTSNANFTVSLGNNAIVCSGQILTLTPKISKAGTYSYLWSDGSIEETLDVRNAGTYWVTVTDTDSGEKVTAKVKVTLSKTPEVNLGKDYVLGKDEVITLDAGNIGCTYRWTTGATTQSIQVNRAGTYGVTVTNGAGCFATDEIIVKHINDIFTINLGGDKDLCIGEELVLNPNPTIKQEYTYLWNTGAKTATLTVNKSGIYSVAVHDKKGNVRTDKAVVTVRNLPIVYLGADIHLYEGETAQLDAGNIGSKFEWSTGATSQVITVSKENVYSVIVTNKYGCRNSDAVNVKVTKGQRFSVDLGGDRQICKGSRIYLEPHIDRTFASEPTYHWLPSEARTKGIYIYKTGKYCVEVTADGATEQDCMELTVNPNPEVNLGGIKYVKSSTSIELDAENPGASYEWNTGEISQIITVNKAGTYSVKVTSNKGCVTKDEVVVNYPEGEYFVGVPSAFSPNGDGKNDVLYIRGNNVSKVNLFVYNRLGECVFQSSRIDVGWDGTYKGTKQNMDVYVYFMRIVFLDGTTVEKRGNVTLLK